MLLSVLKDSVILFLIAFFLLHLIELLLQHISQAQAGNRHFFVINALGLSAGELESLIRVTLKKYNTRLIVVTSKSDLEANAVLDLLCRDYEQIYPVLPEDLSLLITSETNLNTVLKSR